MKIATFNVNGIRSRLPHLLAWLGRERPDIVCLQELKTVDKAFPVDEINDAGYGALWAGQAAWNGVAILARGAEPVESRRGLPGDRRDIQSRYLEAAVHGVLVGCLYLPNGNPRPGPKFDYKLAWFERFIRHAADLMATGHPVVLAGDYNVVPTDADIYDPRNWRRDALLQPEIREAYQRLLGQGWTDALRHTHPDEAIYTFWDYFRQHWPRDRGLRIDHLLLSPDLAARLQDTGVDRWVRDLPKASDHAPVWARWTDTGTPKAATGKASTRKAAARKAVVRAAVTGNEGAKEVAARKAVTGKENAKDVVARKAPVKKAPAKKAAARTVTKKKTATKRNASTSPRPVRKKLAPRDP
jgi:exodeoxyribonuclease-3